MTLLARLLGLLLPACGAPGAQGLPVPPPLDIAQLTRPASPNTALAAPAGFRLAADVATPTYHVPAARLYAAIRAVAAAQPRTYLAAEYPDRLQADWVVRSAMLNFPDLVTARATPTGADAATLVLYSRSVYGYGDFGANRKRVEAWLAALDQMLQPANER
jgi:uncharacterized protein (DUF1499 family)